MLQKHRISSTKDEEAAIKVLEVLGLCHEDVGHGNVQLYGFSTAENAKVGIGGLELYSDTAILRSVVVFDGFRGRGFGGAVVKLLLEEARQQGIKELYLLTYDAQDFFRKFGFMETDRSKAPTALLNSYEFAKGCPDTAICMKMALS